MPDPDPTSRDALLRVVEGASQAAPVLDELSVGDRAALMRTMADALEARRDELVDLAAIETHLPGSRLLGEIGRTTSQLRHFADVVITGDAFEAMIDPADPTASPPRPDIRRMLRSIGPVAVFAASNFPFAFSVAGGDTASALAAGSPVVVKANPGHPRLSDATGDVMAAAAASVAAPPGTIAVVHGFDVGRDLVTHPAIRAVGFTGSLAGGRALFDLATSRDDPIPFHGELGSLNPVVITAGAVAERADELADGLVDSFTLGVGQFCTKPGIVFVPAASNFAERVSDRVPGRSTPMLNDRIAASFHEHVAELDTVDSLRLVAGDARVAEPGSGGPRVYATTVDRLVADPEPVLTERFGPVTILVAYRDEGEVVAALDAIPGSLTLSVHATEREWPALDSLVRASARRAGRIVFDGWPTGVAVTHAMHHGGPWPATTSPLHTSVGSTAIRRWLRPVAWQDCPAEMLPRALQDANPLGWLRRVDGTLRRDTIST